MVMVFRDLRMVMCMKVNGRMIKRMEKAVRNTPMDLSTKVTSLITWDMVKECTRMLRVVFTQEISSMISSMEKEITDASMVNSMKVSTRITNEMDRVNAYTQMELSTVVSSKTT